MPLELWGGCVREEVYVVTLTLEAEARRVSEPGSHANAVTWSVWPVKTSRYMKI
jgi:hypothetical protein